MPPINQAKNFPRQSRGYEKAHRLVERVIEMEQKEGHDHRSHEPDSDQHYQKRAISAKNTAEHFAQKGAKPLEE